MKRVSGRIVVELDDRASKLLRDYLRGKPHACLKPGEDPRDIASAAIVFFMSDPEDGDWCTSDAIFHARSRRLQKERKGVR